MPGPTPAPFAMLALIAATSAAADPAAAPAPIPPGIRAMLDAAIAAGDEADVAVVVKYARAADPASGDAVLAIAETWRATQAKAREARLERARLLDLWTGRLELGGYVTTGNSDTFGVTGIADTTREGLKWRHKLYVQVDYTEALGVATRDHVLASWTPSYKIDDRRYIYGTAQFESDRFLGYDERYATSVGAGYGAVRRPELTLNLELGPAYRQTRFTDGHSQGSLAARTLIDLDWKVTPAITLAQDASAYLERFNSTVSSTTAVSAKLLGPLAASLSYAVQYESDPPAGRTTTDTIGRASLVYTF